MTHGSLFSGIGGFDLAASWMGWENVFQVENDKFCTRVLEKNFPNTKRYGDIKEFDGTKYRGAIDVLTGGFPCQPFSQAGKRKGTEDDRHLWPEMLRVARQIQPAFIVGENVRGLFNWSGGLVFEQVQTDLETQGYEVTSFLLPACAVDAPHRRDRIWFVAHAISDGYSNKPGKGGYKKEEKQREEQREKRNKIQWERNGGDDKRTTTSEAITYPSAFRRIQSKRGNKTGLNNKNSPTISWEGFPTQSPIRDGNDGLPTRLVRHSIAGGGNAVVPQVAFEIFKAIEATLI